MKTRWLAVWALVFGLAATARADFQGDAAAAVRDAGLGKAAVGVYVVDLDANREVASINADSLFIPASNQKLITTAAALSTLGGDFAFRTELRRIDAEDGGVALVVKGDGDPAFCDPKLLAAHKLDVENLLAIWVKAVVDAGIKKVDRLILDDRVFDYRMTHPSWPANQLNAWYCAQVSGLNFYTNCFDIYASPTAAGRTAEVSVLPAAAFVPVTNHAVTGSPENLRINRKAGTNEIEISGTVTRKSTEPNNLTIEDPAAFFGQVLAERLGKAGVTVKAIARPAADAVLPDGKVLHVMRTTLPAVLNRCNKDSQNLFAESLLKRAGFAVTGKPGSWESGVVAVKTFLKTKAGVEDSWAVVVDGSGMSRDNQVTPRAMVRVLSAMARDQKLGKSYIESLAIAGVDGTLAERLKNGLSGRVYAKSGFLNGVSNLSGYVVVPAGEGKSRMFAFSVLCNQVGDVAAAKALQDQIVRMIDRQFSAVNAASDH